jgi:hypothetical protein
MIIQRIVATLVGLVLLAVVFVFVSFFLALAVTVGLLLGGWMWWRSWGRKSGKRGRIIEGEYRIVTRVERRPHRERQSHVSFPHDPGNGKRRDTPL